MFALHDAYAFHDACARGDLTKAQQLISQGAVSAADSNGRQPIHHASSNGHIELVKWLHSEGVPLDAKDNKGWQPIHHASSNGHIELVKWLHSEGMPLDVKDNEGRMPHLVLGQDEKALLEWLTAALATFESIVTLCTPLWPKPELARAAALHTVKALASFGLCTQEEIDDPAILDRELASHALQHVGEIVANVCPQRHDLPLKLQRELLKEIFPLRVHPHINAQQAIDDADGNREASASTIWCDVTSLEARAQTVAEKLFYCSDASNKMGKERARDFILELHGCLDDPNQDELFNLQNRRQLRLIGPSTNGKSHLARWMARLWLRGATNASTGRWIETTIKMTTMEEHLWMAREEGGGSDGAREWWGPLRYLWYLAERHKDARFALILNESNRGGLFNVLNSVWWEKRRARSDGATGFFPSNLVLIFTDNPATADYSVVSGEDAALVKRLPPDVTAALEHDGSTPIRAEECADGENGKLCFSTDQVGLHYCVFEKLVWADGAIPVQDCLHPDGNGRLTFKQPKTAFETWAADQVQVGEIKGLLKLPAGDQLQCIKKAIAAGKLVRNASTQGGSSSSGGGGAGGGQKRPLGGDDSSEPAAKKRSSAGDKTCGGTPVTDMQRIKQVRVWLDEQVKRGKSGAPSQPTRYFHGHLACLTRGGWKDSIEAKEWAPIDGTGFQMRRFYMVKYEKANGPNRQWDYHWDPKECGCDCFADLSHLLNTTKMRAFCLGHAELPAGHRIMTASRDNTNALTGLPDHVKGICLDTF